MVFSNNVIVSSIALIFFLSFRNALHGINYSLINPIDYENLANIIKGHLYDISDNFKS